MARRKETRRKGGKVIGTGSYGCVFSPPLMCKGSSSRPNPDTTVTKLMETDDALQEEGEIKKVLERIRVIPDYGRYTLLNDVYVCEPDVAAITDDDVRGKSCPRAEALRKGRFSDIRLLQLPKGGSEIHDYLDDGGYTDKHGLVQFVKGMHDLLMDFIVPMNNIGVYHQDIKADNVLVNSENQAQLIDWGFLVVNVNSMTPLMSFGDGSYENGSLFRRFMMYNQPLSAALLSGEDETADAYGPLADVAPSELYDTYADGYIDRSNAISAVETSLKSMSYDGRLPGHYEFAYKYLDAAIRVLQKNGELLRDDGGNRVTYKTVIGDYFIRNCEEFTVIGDNGKKQLDAVRLFQHFYRNVDLWGWAMSLAPVMKYTGERSVRVEFESLRLAVARLIVYLFRDGAIRIDPDTMTRIFINLPWYGSTDESSGDETVFHRSPDSSTRFGGRKSNRRRTRVAARKSRRRSSRVRQSSNKRHH